MCSLIGTWEMGKKVSFAKCVQREGEREYMSCRTNFSVENCFKLKKS